ncbi:hypothetical protein BD410DRAFT_792816, partial [Rickenella mellea]
WCLAARKHVRPVTRLGRAIVSAEGFTGVRRRSTSSRNVSNQTYPSPCQRNLHFSPGNRYRVHALGSTWTLETLANGGQWKLQIVDSTRRDRDLLASC